MKSTRKRHAWDVRDRADSRVGPIIAIGFVIAGLLITGVWLYVLGERNRVSADPNTLCPSEGPPSEIVALLLDMSDEFTEPQRLKVMNELSAVSDDIPQFGLIDVYALNGSSEQVIRPVMQRCNPGKGDDLNELYQNPALAKKKWEAFSQELSGELMRLMSASGTPTSPIMESVQATALRTFNLPKYRKLPKRLLIVSDMLQHVPGLASHYESIQNFDSFKSTPYFSKIRADLANVRVTVFYLVRAGTAPSWAAHTLFWEQYFLAQGATVNRIEPVFGD